MEFLRETREGTVLLIYVQPKARKNEIGGIDEWRGRLRVKIKAPPVEGKANREIVKFFSKLLGTEVELVKGETSREKDLLVKGMNKEEVKRKLKDALLRA